MPENNREEKAGASVQPIYSVHVLLPSSLERKLADWAHKTPGASWPSWGGHISLVTRFTSDLTQEEIEAGLVEVCAPIAPFEVDFAKPIHIRDVTRPSYQAVFLVLADADDVESGALYRLRGRVDRQLTAARRPLREELDEQEFLPHITLALGLSEAEAQRMVNQLRSDGIAARFTVDAVWLIVERPEAQPEQRRIPLDAAVQSVAAT